MSEKCKTCGGRGEIERLPEDSPVTMAVSLEPCPDCKPGDDVRQGGRQVKPEKLRDLKAKLEAATPGRWFDTVGSCGLGRVLTGDIGNPEQVTPFIRVEDAALIVAAINNLPELIAAAEELALDARERQPRDFNPDWDKPYAHKPGRGRPANAAAIAEARRQGQDEAIEAVVSLIHQMIHDLDEPAFRAAILRQLGRDDK